MTPTEHRSHRRTRRPRGQSGPAAAALHPDGQRVADILVLRRSDRLRSRRGGARVDARDGAAQDPDRRGARESRLRIIAAERDSDKCSSTAVPLDGDTPEMLVFGFAGVKGFAGGFGRRALGPWGEDMMKRFVHEAVGEAFETRIGARAVAERTPDCGSALRADRSTVEGEPLGLSLSRCSRFSRYRSVATP